MTDKDKAIAALTLALDTCAAALTSLPQPHPDPPNTPATTLHKDFVSLLSLLYGLTTKVSLALKPSSPTYSASVSPLRDIAQHTSSLSHLVKLYNPARHGITLSQEVTFAAEDVIESIKALVQTFLTIETSDARDSTGKSGDEYMVRTGAIHDAIDKARRVSSTNLAAVSQKWGQNGGALDDGFREVGVMIEDAASDSADAAAGYDDDDDDGWDELGLSGAKMDKDEVERTKKVYDILRLTILLHKRIFSDVLKPTPTPSDVESQNKSLDVLLSHSSSLSSASDELISTLYTPQDPSAVAAELESFMAVITLIEQSLEDLLPSLALEGMLADLNVTSGAKNKKDPRKWFSTCFKQLRMTAQAFGLLLVDSTGS